MNPDLPVISAWMIETPAPSERAVMVRNPYYHAVDAEGNQLPYIDYVTHDLFESGETANLWVVQGLIDMQGRHISGIANYTLFKENEEAGNYEVVLWKRASTSALFPNLNVEDPFLNELFNDVRFRQAVSHALNRDEINDVDLNGLGEPRQASPASGSPQYDAEFESKWVEYDLDTGNALLDEIGLTERDGDGFRLRPDGETLEIIITTRSNDPSLELLPAYLEGIGIKASVSILERSLFEELTAAGDYEIVTTVLVIQFYQLTPAHTLVSTPSGRRCMANGLIRVVNLALNHQKDTDLGCLVSMDERANGANIGRSPDVRPRNGQRTQRTCMDDWYSWVNPHQSTSRAMLMGISSRPAWLAMTRCATLVLVSPHNSFLMLNSE